MAAETCNQAVTKSAPGTAVYRRRQPERSAVYQVVQGHLETWLAAGRHMDEDGFPVAASILTGRGTLVHLSENGLKTYHVRPQISQGLSLHPQISRTQIKSLDKKISIG